MAGPFVAINSAALPDTLLESELFGHERGAFTGAVVQKAGLFSAADGGTLFFDEVGELSPAAQAKLLRVLETKQITPLGALRPTLVDVRVLAATNRNLEAEVQAGRFRRDLYFRLKGARLWMPPLRDRRSEILPMAELYLERACARAGRPRMALAPGAIAVLAGHDWPGNVRELAALMELAGGVVHEDRIEAHHLEELLGSPRSAPPAPPPPAPAPGQARAMGGPFRPIHDELRELERERMQAALAATGGNRKRAAELIAMPRRTFMAKLRAYGLSGQAAGGAGDDGD
jgi:DNA-binding NtrC family response regulator